MLIKHQLRSNFFIISGFHPLFDKEPLLLKLVTSMEFESMNAAVKGQCVKPLHQLAKK